ncbi:hypothetical protein PMG11_06550 [Penicillium brasilianum]|uniref:Uncharacterized protein n=1 Tax=Penicillium brasilianum TaxID=104259 RepID=A0A0F7TS67_PENBI|nr:hypothetical protein PMG11_06550 [Penicillium brasilianum]
MIISAVFASALSLVIAVQAQPRSVTNTPVDGCWALPRWNNETKIAGPWSFQLWGCRNGTASNGACGIEGYGATCDAKRAEDGRGFDHGIITISDNAQNAKTIFRCNGALHTFEAYVPSGAGALDWHAIGIRRDPRTDEMEWGLRSKESESIEVYQQYSLGEPVDGFLLGSQGQTDWVVRYSGSDVSNLEHRSFWSLRLVGSKTKRRAGEYETKLRIDSV